MKHTKNVLRKIMLAYKSMLYHIALITVKVDERTIVFEAFQGRSYACNPKGIYEAMKANSQYKDYQFIWAFRNVKEHQNLEDSRTKVVAFESLEYYRALAKAKYWVFNSNTRKFLKPTAKHVFVQTWHGTPLKKIGCDVKKEGSKVTALKDISKNYTDEAKKISYMISPSRYCTGKLVSAFNLKSLGKENIVLETGYPRNDSLFCLTEKKITDIKYKLNIPKDKKTIMYAPTFRDNAHSQTAGYDLKIGIDFGALQKQLGEEYVILFRAHYFIAKHMNVEQYQGFVYDVSMVDDVNEVYAISDMLITDYSSVFFDYANLKRPILFFMYDYNEYKSQVRDFYLDVNELPGRILDNQDSLVEEIKEVTSKPFVPDATYIQFNNKYNYLDGPDCGLKAAQVIIKK